MKTLVPTQMLSSVLAWIAPLRCVVCDGAVEAGLSWPLCSSCAASIIVAGGRRCTVCGKPIISELTRCMRCRTAAVSFDGAFPLYSYTGATRRLLIAYKAKKRRSLANFLALRLAPEIQARFPGHTIVPVPPRPGKLRKEGWDQVELLAGILEHRCGLPVERLLVRKKGGNEQKTLDRDGRRTNVAGRYALIAGINKAVSATPEHGTGTSNDPVVAIPVRILLLDDIMTTGATLSECASVLKLHGHYCVHAMVIAAD